MKRSTPLAAARDMRCRLGPSHPSRAASWPRGSGTPTARRGGLPAGEVGGTSDRRGPKVSSATRLMAHELSVVLKLHGTPKRKEESRPPRGQYTVSAAGDGVSAPRRSASRPPACFAPPRQRPANDDRIMHLHTRHTCSHGAPSHHHRVPHQQQQGTARRQRPPRLLRTRSSPATDGGKFHGSVTRPTARAAAHVPPLIAACPG